MPVIYKKKNRSWMSFWSRSKIRFPPSFCRICCGSSRTLPVHDHVPGGLHHHHNDCAFCLCHLHQWGFGCWRRLLYPLLVLSLVGLIIWLWAQKSLNLDHQTWSAEPWVQSLGAASGSCFSLQMCAAVLCTFWVWSKRSRLPLAFQKVRCFFSDSQAKSLSYLKTAGFQEDC